MLTRIIQHEWRTLRADRTLLIIVPLFAVLIGYGVYNGASWATFQRATLRAAHEEEGARFLKAKADIAAIEQGRMVSVHANPRFASVAARSVGARYATLPPAPLAALSVGQSDLYPYYFKVTQQSRQSFANNDELENPSNLLAGRFDLAFVIVYLYPLLILALSYNLLSQEREQGTLAMLMAQPLSLARFMTGKVLLRAAVVLALTFGFSLLGFLLSGALKESGFGRLALWLGVVIAYGAFWFAVAVLVNAFGKSSSANALTLAGLWLVFVLIIPSLLNVVVMTAYPVPSRVEMIQATRRASAAANAQGSTVLAKYFEDHPELAATGAADANDFYTKQIATQAETERLIQPVLAHFDRQVLGQQRLVNRLRFLSPAIVAQTALNDIAGTSGARYQHFLSLVDNFHQRWQAHFYPRIVQKALLKPADYDGFPQFRFAEESTAAMVQRVLFGLIGLLLPVALLGWLGVAKLRHYSLAS